jgi:hypothetical protein
MGNTKDPRFQEVAFERCLDYLVVRRRNDWGSSIGVRAGQDLEVGITKSATDH